MTYEPKSFAHPDMSPLRLPWLWRGYVPRLCLTELFGAGGKRKGFVAADLLARWTRGDFMPDGNHETGPCSVISITKEDLVREGMAWRYQAAGAVPDYIFDLSFPGGQGFTLDENGIEQVYGLAQAINRHEKGTPFEKVPDLGVLYLDPLMGMAPKTLSNNVTFRQVVQEPLDAFCRTFKCGCLLMNHSTKDDGVVAGSAAAVQGPRMVLQVGEVKNRPGYRSFGIYKTNITADDKEPLVYTTEGHDEGIHVVWDCEQPGEGYSSGEPHLYAVPSPAPAPSSPADMFRNLNRYA